MYNTFNFNAKTFNDLGFLTAEGASDNIVFNDYSLQNTDIVTQILLQDSTPERDFGTSAVPRGDGQIITGDFWRKKVVKLKGVIHKSTNSLLEAELDAMKKALAVAEANLDIVIDGVTRRYVATMTSGHDLFSERKGYHVTFCPFNVEFTTVEPYGKSIDYNASGFLATSSLAFNEEVTNSGTVHAKPVVILNITAANTVTAVSFKNNTTGEEIKVTMALNAGDYVIFDSEEMQVTVTGVVKDYTGSFPNLATGANSFTITVTGVSCTYDLTVKHKTTYL